MKPWTRVDFRPLFAVLWFLPAFLMAGWWLRLSDVGAQEAAKRESASEARFVGSAACAGCHATQHTDWRKSHHAASMQIASDATVLGRFDNSKFSNDGIESRFFKKDGKFWVRTDGPDGKSADFEIKYTFGLTPLQQYLIELPGGRLQALGIAWDSRPLGLGGQRWYHLYPNAKLGPGDPQHWTGVDQNWNYQCAWCHSTNLKKNYDRATKTFKTQWSEISVGCEACHGPASEHLSWASKPRGKQDREIVGKGFGFRFDQRAGASWTLSPSGQPTRSKPPSSAVELQVCAGCHARREQFSDSALDVRKYYDAFRTARLEPRLYYADGQQRDEVFNHGSFLQSKMHAAGVTCSDCHNPHSGKLRENGNGVCTQCHQADRFDIPAHHHHMPGSAGAKCATCHMPTTVYMGVDARHDHSIRIPRPDRTQSMGAPNACAQCHSDKPAAWAAEALSTWYPSSNGGAQVFAEAFDLGDRGAPGAQEALIRVAEDSALSGLVRASAVTRLARLPSPKVMRTIARLLQADDPELRSAAVAGLAGLDATARRDLLAPLLRDATRLVRMVAARELSGDAEAKLSPEDRQHFERALAEYVAAQTFNAERPEALTNLADVHRRRGMTDQAREDLREALAVDRSFIPAAIALADLEREKGDERRAEEVLRRSLADNAKSGPLLHALGLSLVRQKRMEDALVSLADAARLAPETPRFAYVFAVATHGAGNRAAAIAILKEALTRHPHDREMLSALIPYEIETRDFSSALLHAELLLRLEPERSDIEQLIANMRRRL